MNSPLAQLLKRPEIARFEETAFREKYQLIRAVERKLEGVKVAPVADEAMREELAGIYGELKFLITCEMLNDKGIGYVRKMVGLPPRGV